MKTKSSLKHLSHSPVHTHIHALMAEATMQGGNPLTGAILGSVSCQNAV